MIKKVLFVSSILFTGLISAQSLQLMDHFDNSIDGVNHNEYGNGLYLSETKFHVKNLTGTTVNYTAKAYEITNPTSQDLQICFGTQCYTASNGVAAGQTVAGSATIAGNDIDSSFKVAPFSFGWVAGDSAVWRITVHNVSNASDSSSSIIKWKVGTSGIVEVDVMEASFSAYPNPATNNLAINYNITGDVKTSKIEVFDILGKSIATYGLNNAKGKLNLDVNKFNSGVYFYTIYANNQALRTERVIIK